MKKFYAFAAAALFAVAANAQNLYICGAGEGLAWEPGSPAEMTLVDGNYVFESAGLTQFKISTTMGSWDEFNAGALTCNYPEDQAGVTVALEPGDRNISTPWKGDYKITVSGDMQNITLTTSTPKPEGVQYPELYFRGGMNGWGSDDAWKFEPVTLTIQKFVCDDAQQITAGEEFKVADADWNKYNYGSAEDPNIMLETEMELTYNGSNLKVEENFNGIAWINLDIDGMTYLILSNDKTFVPDWEGLDSAVNVIEVSNEAPVYFNLQGVRVANPANGIYVKVVNGKAVKAVIK